MVEKDNVWANTVNLVRKAKQNFGEKKITGKREG